MKVFISMKMRGLSKEVIEQRQKEILDVVKSKYPDNEIKHLKNFLGDGNYTPLVCLSKSLEIMSKADLAVFDTGWREGRGTAIEHACAVSYNVPIMYMSD